MAGPAEPRPANAAALPKMRATFPLQVMGELGLNNGDVWWMDSSELLFWCPELLPVGADLRGRVDLRNGRTIEVHVRLLQSETPLRHEKGYLQIAGWSAAVPRDGKVALERLRETCPAVFKSDYRPPKLPAKAEEVAAAEAAKVREPTEAEVMAQRHAQQMAEEETAYAALTRRRRPVGIAVLIGGALIGGGLAVLSQEASFFRWTAFVFDPHMAVEKGLLAGANFAGRDLSAAKLAGADLQRSVLTGALLAGAELQNAHLQGADLRRADLSGANLAGADLSGAAMEGSLLRGADLRGADVSTDLADADAVGAVFSPQTKWAMGHAPDGAVGPGASGEGRTYESLIAVKMDLTRMNFGHATAHNAKLAGATLAEASLFGADFAGADFSETDLTTAAFAEVRCDSCSFARAKMGSFKGLGGVFTSADFRGSHGDGVDLRGAKLAGAKFGTSRWGGADLRGADLSSSDLSAVDWTRCALTGADLSGATLSGAHLAGCVSDSETRWPPGAAARNYGVLEIVAGGDALGAVLPAGIDLSSRSLAHLNGARMTAEGVNWNGADLSSSDLSNASLAGGTFVGSKLTGVNFSGANLSGAKFSGASVAGANFAQADVCGADFATVDLAGTDFSRASACSTTAWPRNRPPKGITIR